ncbi:MAG TPA: PilZ domain-containing protein [Polyangiales bacterium]|nr:PilZ domain-containing protein [Polyangiales bacterium]
MENRRKHQRFRAAIAAEIEVDSSLYEGVTRDVSLTGASILAQAPLVDGSQIIVTLLLTEDGIAAADSDPLTLRAEIMWASEPTHEGTLAGVRFLQVSPADSKRLSSLLTAISVRPPARR